MKTYGIVTIFTDIFRFYSETDQTAEKQDQENLFHIL